MEKNIHGGDIYCYIEEKQQQPIDFSANINPLGLPKGVKKVLRESVDAYSHYPDVNCSRLKCAISQFESIERDMITIGNGAADLIYKLVHTIKPQRALLPAPTFFEYEGALRNINCHVTFYGLSPDHSFEVGEDLLNQISGIDLLILCNPNNPTGVLIHRDLMIKIVQKCKEKGCKLMVDECFMDFIAEQDKVSVKNLLEKNDHLFLLKAFTKTFAMAGLRLGYLLSSNQPILRSIEVNGQPWNVSVPAQLAGVEALKDSDYLQKTLLNTEKERQFLINRLKKLPVDIFDGKANYLLFCLHEKFDLYHALFQKGILIRRCENYRGLDERYYRIAVKSHPDNVKLIKALKEILGGTENG